MIKIKKTDSIVDIILKMKEEKWDKIILNFPFGHSILHNYTSLKILKTKAEKKELIISTNDVTAKKIWKKLGIKYSITSNEDVIKHNYTFWEYLIYTIKSSFKDVSDTILEKWKNSSVYKYHKFQNNWKISYFIAFLIISILLLFFVFYFAVNKTYVYIKPEIEIKQRAKNFIFKEVENYDSIEDDKVIKVKKIENTINLKETFWTSGVKFDNLLNAKWKVKIYNLLNEKISLVKNTRLQTKEWQVFLLQNEISIKAATKEDWKVIPWEKEIEVIARVKDAKWRIIWKNWNIKKWKVLTLPWLKNDKNKIYAISTTQFSWGSDKYTKILTQEDLDKAKKILRWKLENLGIKEIRKKIIEENELNGINYNILERKWAIKYYDFEVTGIEKLKIWEEMENFEIFWTIKTKAYIYNKELLLSKLKNSIKENIMEESEKLISIDEKSFDVILELRQKEEPFELKATVKVDAFFTQNFLNKDNNFTEKLKNFIAWKTKEEAEKFLINNNKIANARIKIRPFFIKNISKLTENIEFKIEK